MVLVFRVLQTALAWPLSTQTGSDEARSEPCDTSEVPPTIQEPADQPSERPRDSRIDSPTNPASVATKTPVPRGADRPVSAAWRPQPRQRRIGHTKQMFLAVAIALFVGGWVLFAFSRIANTSPDKIKLGSRVFSLGSARARASTIARTGPLFFNDLVQGGRTLPIVVMYLGVNPGAKGVVDANDFAALNAIPPGATPACPVVWNPAPDLFRQPCSKLLYLPDGSLAESQADGTLTAKASALRTTDAGAMERFDVLIGKKGQLVIDLQRHFGETPAATSVPPTIVLR